MEQDIARLRTKLEEQLSKLDPKVQEQIRSQISTQNKSKEIVESKSRNINEDFEKFIGFWQTSSANLDNNDLVEFYDNGGVMSVRYYTGTPQNWREYNNNDTPTYQPSTVSIIDPNAVLLNIQLLILSSPEEPYTTFRIQEDGSGVFDIYDTPGGFLQATKYEKLEEEPVIQRNDESSLVNWNDPVKMAEYVYQYFGSVVGPQKADDLHDANYVGREKYDENFQQLLTTGWTRTATTSSAFRAGKHIGVWKTQFPESFPVTTLHTSEPHKFNFASVLEITGFTGPFSVLNGEHRVSLLPSSTLDANPPYPWANENSFEYLVMVDVDTSGIVEEYNPLVHGFGHLKSIHEPVTTETEYRSMIASLFDFVISSFGETTHNRFQPWVVNGKIPETFDDLNSALKDGSAENSRNFGMRTFESNGTALFYYNYQVQGVLSRSMNINDPYGLGNVEDKPEFDIDIDVENYLCEDKKFNLFWTVTGDPLAALPITASLTFFGYPSNGNKVVYKIAPFQQVPEPLVDEWGVHPYFYYGFSGLSGSSPELESHNNFVCGIIQKKKTKHCETVAYIRIRDEDSVDGAGLFLFFPTIFGVDGISNKSSGTESIAMATVLEELNKYKPTKYIIDSRANDGGFIPVVNAWASLFGANRPNSAYSWTTVANDTIPIQAITGSGYESGNMTLQENSLIQSTINTDEIAALYPQSMVRSNDPKKKLQVVILTTTRSGSGGDLLPHAFIGTNPTNTVHDLGFNVESTIVCDINGILDGALRGFDAIAINTINEESPEPRLTNDSGDGITPLYLAGETLTSFSDRIGPFNNFTTQVIPDKLLETWYDNTQWRDLGLIEGNVEYPIRGNLPKRSDNTTWRDYQLEEAIAHRSKKRCRCKCKSCKNRYCKKL